MSKVLMCYFADVGVPTYDALTDALVNNNNQVLRFNVKDYVDRSNGIDKAYLKDSSICRYIDIFDPDLVLSFNNALPLEIVEKLTCDIYVIDADAPYPYFWYKNYLKENISRFKYLGLQTSSKSIYENFFRQKLNDKNYLFFSIATALQKEGLHQDKNISFIGTNFLPTWLPTSKNFYMSFTLDLYKKFQKTFYLDVEEEYKLYLKQYSRFFYSLKKAMNKKEFKHYYNEINHFLSGQHRMHFLSTLKDLGLTVYGDDGWKKIGFYDFGLRSCYNSKKITNLKDNQWVYNTSKIAVNISHLQASTSFSWRVMDIMASNACLLMEKKPDWQLLFGEHIAKEIQDVILYNDEYDLREKAKYLLANEVTRRECVRSCQNAIEKAGRWESRLKQLEEWGGICLTGLKGFKGKETFINSNSFNFNSRTHCSQNISVTKSNKGITNLFSLKKLFNTIVIKFKLIYLLLCALIINILCIDCVLGIGSSIRRSLNKKLIKKLSDTIYRKSHNEL